MSHLVGKLFQGGKGKKMLSSAYLGFVEDPTEHEEQPYPIPVFTKNNQYVESLSNVFGMMSEEAKGFLGLSNNFVIVQHTKKSVVVIDHQSKIVVKYFDLRTYGQRMMFEREKKGHLFVRSVGLHSSLARVLYIDEESKNHAFVLLEYAGTDSFELMEAAQLGKFPWYPIRFAMMAKSLVKALRFLHKGGVIHRDVKPENFAVDTAMDQSKLIDFGFCKPFSEFNFEVEGTVPFIPPFVFDETEKKQFLKNHTFENANIALDVFAAALTILSFAGIVFTHANAKSIQHEIPNEVESKMDSGGSETDECVDAAWIFFDITAISNMWRSDANLVKRINNNSYVHMKLSLDDNTREIRIIKLCCGIFLNFVDYKRGKWFINQKTAREGGMYYKYYNNRTDEIEMTLKPWPQLWDELASIY